MEGLWACWDRNSAEIPIASFSPSSVPVPGHYHPFLMLQLVLMIGRGGMGLAAEEPSSTKPLSPRSASFMLTQIVEGRTDSHGSDKVSTCG